MKVYFIVHGNAGTGMGHIIRSLSLADTFRARGHEVAFFSKYREGIRRIQEAGIDVYGIPGETCTVSHRGFFYGDAGELEMDLKAIRSQIPAHADAIIVDSYNVSQDFFRGLKELTGCLVYIDDLDLFHYPVDLLVNGTASAFDMGYEKSQSAQLLLGLGYNQVRREFSHLPLRGDSGDITDILITTGNGDPFHMTERILGILTGEKALSGIRYHVVVGGGFDKSIWSDPAVADNEQILLYDAPKDMWEVMGRCDMAVSAGGSTLYELVASGVPAAVFAYADNQLLHIRALEREGLLRYIGYYDKLDGQSLVSYIKYLMRCPDIREKISERQRSLVDGRGCERIVGEIERSHRDKMEKDHRDSEKGGGI